MNDRDFLIWIHERLEYVHKENHLYDYMHRLRAIISSIPEGQCTPSVEGMNNLEDLKKKLENKRFHCKVCNSKGFEPSITGEGCTFCDGTEGGNPPEVTK